ncbi:hypothetical protein DICPUDRAFT_76360 [Dictyostelium purpureum]|uniref:Uncharacterized protein n=1 Tax=Dictyostelium purpureum TaxID=5786 RepID=F0ZDD4_DICPU|nr:uncharacterized protein DICPUDRAFT_76360 [Dictyostelium purpureum]EGC38047.1 hypothetical protein DICPUDRAFT_76360 [Dictyostelium purpureum]|eukprot:XP_003285448.1 hypothetical protein DICPUDRAFT_76360 [Dictyostelium purpureum]
MKIYLVLFLIIINLIKTQAYGETFFLNFNGTEFYFPSWRERELMAMVSALRINVDEYIDSFMVPDGYTNTSNLFQQYPKYQRPFLISKTMNEISRMNILKIVQECEIKNNNGSICNFIELNKYARNYFGSLNYNQLFQNYSCLNPNTLSIQGVDGVDQFGHYSGIDFVNRLACQGNRQCTTNNEINNFRQFVTSPLTLYSGISIMDTFTNNNNISLPQSTSYLYDFFSSTSYCTDDKSSIDRDLVAIASASHSFRGGNQSITFIANYYSYTHEIPESIQVIIIDLPSTKETTLTLELMYNGLSNYSGVYSVVSDTYTPCNSYYFIAKISKSKSIRYPTTDNLSIDDSNNNCIFLNSSLKAKILDKSLIIIILIFINFILF